MTNLKQQAAIELLKRRQATNEKYNWQKHARPNQLPPPGNWTNWLLLAGRGFGKTRTGSEYVRHQVETNQAARIALIAPTAADARDVMVEGESGILNISPPWNRPTYEPSKRRLTWRNGTIATMYSAEEPERLRGPQHDLLWGDELAAWQYYETWDMAMLGLRLGNPKAIITTTPKPNKLILELIKDPNTTITTGSTFDNRENLAPIFLQQIITKYEGTRLGRQELYAELLTDNPEALWTHTLIQNAKAKRPIPQLKKIIVSIDPAVTSGENSDLTGIIIAGKDHKDHYHILADRTTKMTPDGWATRALNAFDEFEADAIIAETNNGGDLVESIMRTKRPNIPYKKVTATRGKRVRAEPIAALYEQGKVSHHGDLTDLEAQMANFTPEGNSESPDRVDALVWALTELSTPINERHYAL
jgi:phage terminase large subunit-like protein